MKREKLGGKEKEFTTQKMKKKKDCHKKFKTIRRYIERETLMKKQKNSSEEKAFVDTVQRTH